MPQGTTRSRRPRRTPPPPPPPPRRIEAETEPRFSETMWFKLGGADDSAAAALLARPATDEAELEVRYVDSGLLTIEDERAYSLNQAPARALSQEETLFLDRYTDEDIRRYMVHDRVPGRRRIGLVVGIGVFAISVAAFAFPAGDVVDDVEHIARAEQAAPLVAVAAPAPAFDTQPAEPAAAHDERAKPESQRVAERRSERVAAERAERAKAKRIERRRAQRAQRAKAKRLQRAKARRLKRAKARRAKRRAQRAKLRKKRRERRRRRRR